MSMFGNGYAEWDAETYAAEKAEFHRLREKLKLGNDFWTPLEWAKSLHAEVERLRAENLLLAMANADRENMKAKLAWFENREWIVIAVIEAAEPYSTALHNAVSTFKKWIGANPRPGAGV